MENLREKVDIHSVDLKKKLGSICRYALSDENIRFRIRFKILLSLGLSAWSLIGYIKYFSGYFFEYEQWQNLLLAYSNLIYRLVQLHFLVLVGLCILVHLTAASFTIVESFTKIENRWTHNILHSYYAGIVTVGIMLNHVEAADVVQILVDLSIT